MVANQHTKHMDKALAEARLAYVHNEVPVGAIVVGPDGTVLARAHNQVESQYTQSAHAEIIAITHAGEALTNWRLNQCWLYVTLEPCLMCISLAILSRMAGIVYGAQSPQFGFMGYHTMSNEIVEGSGIEIIEGVGADESANLLKEFFQKKRSHHE